MFKTLIAKIELLYWIDKEENIKEVLETLTDEQKVWAKEMFKSLNDPEIKPFLLMFFKRRGFKLFEKIYKLL